MTMATGKLVSQKELAAIFGITGQTILSWEGKGCPVESKDGPNRMNLYDTAKVIEWRIENPFGRGKPLAKLATFNEARAKKVQAEAEIAELNLAKMQGELIEIDVAMEEIGGALSACRAKLLSIGSKLAPRLELVQDHATRKEMIDDAISEALSEISDGGTSVLARAAEKDQGTSPEGDDDPDEASSEAVA